SRGPRSARRCEAGVLDDGSAPVWRLLRQSRGRRGGGAPRRNVEWKSTRYHSLVRRTEEAHADTLVAVGNSDPHYHFAGSSFAIGPSLRYGLLLDLPQSLGICASALTARPGGDTAACRPAPTAAAARPAGARAAAGRRIPRRRGRAGRARREAAASRTG